MRNSSWKEKSNKISRLRPIHRFLMVLLGVFITFLVIEIALRIGSIIAWNLEKRDIDIDKDSYNILCVGDSFTYGLGASVDESYPLHLQRILDEEFRTGFARVHSRGIPGQNSSQARDKLLSQLKTTHTRVLIILVGHNNYWNFNNLHLEGITPGLAMKIEQVLAHLKVYRLLKILMTNLSEKIIRSRNADDDILEGYFKFQESQQRMDKFQEEIKEYEQYLSEHPQEVYPYMKLATVYRDMGKKDRALLFEALARGIDRIEAERLVKELREIEKSRRSQEQGEEPQEKGFRHMLFQAILRRRGTPRTGRAFRRYLDYQKEIVEEVLRQDLIWMVKAARQRGVKVIISSYPVKKKANRILREISALLEIPFVDQTATFQAPGGGVPYSVYFTLDNHCTGAGYRKMAENITKALMELL